MERESDGTWATPAERALVDACARLGDTGPGGLPLFLLDVDEVVELLGVGRTFVYGLLRSGELRSCKLGARTKIPAQSVLAYVQRRLAESAAQDAGLAASVAARRSRR